MSDQISDQFSADKVREIIEEMHRHANSGNVRGSEEMNIRYFAEKLSELVPSTLAEMTDKEQEACQWMRADLEGGECRAVIINPFWEDGRARVLWPGGFIEEIDWREITPRPDLPRMMWPGDTKGALALPNGWQLADHEEYGRVIVTNTIPDVDGHVYIMDTANTALVPQGHVCRHCRPDELTYIDIGQGTDTSDAVPPSTLVAMIAGMHTEYAVSLSDGTPVGLGWGTYDTALEDMNAWRRDGCDAHIVRRYVTEQEKA